MKMKQKRYRGALLVLLGSVLLSGCGMMETPYELTEEEQQLIVSYSAHAVSKFNNFQKDGITYVPDSDMEDSVESEVVPETETEQPEENTETVITENEGEIVETEMEEPVEETTLDSVFANTGLHFSYLGNEVTASYMEDDTYAVNAGLGKNLVVLKIKVENLTEEAITIDNMASTDVYSLKYQMESGNLYNAKSVMTLLLHDFTTFEGTIEPQAAMDMVIVFEIPAETTEVNEAELKIQRENNIFQINL